MSTEDLAREALARAKADAARRGAVPGRLPRRRSGGQPAGQWSPAGAGERDPQPLAAELDRLADTAGWAATLPAARVMGSWDALVGADVARHCRPERLVDGELTLVAESTAWATQLRLLARSLLGRLAAELGPGVVVRLRVHGPAAPSWRHGPRRVRGPGPRDTYG